MVPPSEIPVDKFIGEQKVEDRKYVNTEPIKKLKEKGHTLEEVLDKYRSGDINFEYDRRYNECMSILREKEKKCNVIVSDYIEQNVRKHKLFLSQNHPTTRVFVHCANQVLNILGILTRFNHDDYDENVTNLPCFWIRTSYDMKYWGFEYEEPIDDEHYIPHITNIYNMV